MQSPGVTGNASTKFSRRSIGKAAEGLAAGEEDCSDRVHKPPLGRFGGEVGRGNGVCGTVHYSAVRTPCIAAGSIDGHGVLRLHSVIGFANDKVPLRMTELKTADR